MNLIRGMGGIDHYNPLRFLSGQRKIAQTDFLMKGSGLFFKTGLLLGGLGFIDPLPGPAQAYVNRQVQ